MKRLCFILAVVLCSHCFGDKSPQITHARVIKTTETGEIFIDASAKQKTKFDIFKIEKIADASDPNKIHSIEIPVGRITITQTFENYSIGTIISKIDGSKPKISDISAGMICRPTTKATLKAEKQIYKNQKKALKRQYKLAKTKAKSGVYESLETTVADTNDTSTLKVGGIRVEKPAKDPNETKEK
ncbi:MAG: hypothetical protein WCZ89_02655 [Phycisphaerae bacterium]